MTLGDSEQNVTRQFDVTNPVKANGTGAVETLAAVFDLSRPVAFDSLRLLPQLDIGASALRGTAVHEWGAGAQDLLIEADTNVHEWIEPSLGLDDSIDLAHRSTLHAFARVGAMTFLGQTSAVTHAGFEGAPEGTPDMRVTAEMGRTALTAEGGQPPRQHHLPADRDSGELSVGGSAPAAISPLRPFRDRPPGLRRPRA